MVMTGHLVSQWQIGTYAVFGFYTISGYLMTLIMHESYGYSFIGRTRFALNRFLRLYPLYWLAAILSILLILWVGSDSVRNYHQAMFLPETNVQIASNISMIYIGLFPQQFMPRLVPPTWALTVEIIFYSAICLGLSKNLFRVYIWLGISIVYFLLSFSVKHGWQYRYYPIFAASLPFAVGSLIFFLQRKKESFALHNRLTNPLSLLILIIINMVIVVLWKDYFEFGFYISFLLNAILVCKLAGGGKWPLLSRKVDEWIGSYSYPIYLFHWQIGLAVSSVVFLKPRHESTTIGIYNLILSLCCVVILSYLLVKYVDIPIQTIRLKIKSGKNYQRRQHKD